MRKCIICQENKPKKDLFRILKHDNQVIYDPSGKMNGRGAYICRENDCLNQAMTTKKVISIMGSPLDEESLDKMKFELNGREDIKEV